MTTSTDDQLTTSEPFHFISGLSGNEAEAVIPLMWCVQPATRQYFVDNEILDPQFLITVIHDAGEAAEANRYTEMDRYIVPLERGMEYVRFRRPGTNIVKGTIVWGLNYSVRKVRHFFKAKDATGSFQAGVIDSDAELADSFREAHGFIRWDLIRYPHVTEIAVQVSPQVFAKPSPQFEKDFFAKFSNKPVDECARRGRRILWLFSPVILGVSTLGKALGYLGGKIIGFRHLSPRPLLHPFSTGIMNVYDDVDPYEDGIFWYTKSSPTGVIPRAYPFLFLSPATVLAGWGLLSLMAAFAHTNTYIVHNRTVNVHGVHWFHLAWWQGLVWSLGIHLGVALLLTIVMFLLMAGLFIYETALPAERRKALRAQRAANQLAKKEARSKKKLNFLDRLLESMSCETLPSEVSLQALPKERRVRHLRFQALKKRVCRPFPQ